LGIGAWPVARRVPFLEPVELILGAALSLPKGSSIAMDIGNSSPGSRKIGTGITDRSESYLLAKVAIIKFVNLPDFDGNPKYNELLSLHL